MSTTAMVVLIVLIVTIGRVLRPRFRPHREGTAIESADALAGRARLEDEMRQRKERIAVLERAITDSHSSASLDREIERLRDR